MVCRALVGGVLSVVSAGCWGLSLGQFAGQATMGRALDIHIPLGLASGESTADLCPVVKVYFAEDVLPSGQVKVAFRSDAANGGTELHVSTVAVLNEPYARIDVIAGCTNQFSRQYTILTDLPALETPQPAKVAQSIALPVSQMLSVQPAGAQGRVRASLSDGTRVGAASAKAIRVAKDTIQLATKPAQRRDRARDETSVSQGDRLKLDPVELMASLAQLAPSLKLESDSFSATEHAPDPDLMHRRAAARALWQALNEAPEQIATNAAKADTSGAEGQRLKAQLAVARQSEADLQVALDSEREGIYTHPLVLALGGGLLLALGGLAVLWRRKQTPEEEKLPWWKRPIGKSVAAKNPPKNKKEPSALKAAMQKLVPASKTPIDIDVDTLFPPDSELGDRQARRDPLKKKSAHGPTTLSGQDFLASTLMDGARSVATEELFDLQQQVEFFISLGQAEQAVDVLVNHLSDSHEPSPLAYLDLLRLYHDLDRRTDYEALRKDFNRLFNGSAPAFDEYSYSRRGLERYEAALSRIQSLWGRPAVLDVIERSIFRQSSTQDHEVFDLEAYRELLLLYGIAREIIAPESSMGALGSLAAAPQAPGATVLQPLVAQTRESRERESALPLLAPVELHDDVLPTPSEADVSSEQLDIDLSSDFDLSIDKPALAGTSTKATTAAALPGEDADPMSFDLSDSLFDSLPEPGETAHTPIRYAGKLPPQIDDGASLDFSGLDDIEAFTIKKSGTKA